MALLDLIELQDSVIEAQIARCELRLALRRLIEEINHNLPNKDYTPLPQLSGVGSEKK